MPLTPAQILATPGLVQDSPSLHPQHGRWLGAGLLPTLAGMDAATAAAAAGLPTRYSYRNPGLDIVASGLGEQIAFQSPLPAGLLAYDGARLDWRAVVSPRAIPLGPISYRVRLYLGSPTPGFELCDSGALTLDVHSWAGEGYAIGNVTGGATILEHAGLDGLAASPGKITAAGGPFLDPFLGQLFTLTVQWSAVDLGAAVALVTLQADAWKAAPDFPPMP